MKKINLLLFTALASLFFTACVSKKKYLQMEKTYLRTENALLNAAENIKVLEADTAYLGEELRQSRQKVKDTEMYSEYTQSTLSQKIKELELTLAKQDFALQGRDKYLAEQASKLAAKELLLESKVSQLREVEALIRQENAILDSVNAFLALTLETFDEEELTVVTKNGRVYISMSDNLLFPNGSFSISKKGQEALKKLAALLQEQDHIMIHVEGHTDDKPISGKAVRDNWDLSVLRATSVTQVLVSEGVLPWRIIPSGRAEFVPIVENITKEDRQINRRTEIILEPDMRPLLKLLEIKIAIPSQE